MKVNRRNFFVWAGLGCLSFLGLGAWVKTQMGSTNALKTIPSEQGETAISPTSQVVSSTQPILRFVAIADTGSGDRNQYAVAEAMERYRQKHPYSLVILAGDNIYDHGEIEKIAAVFEKPYQTLLKAGVKFRAALGNHDIRTDNGDPQVKYPGFNMKQRYYTFQEQEVQFFVLDTNGNADWDAQLAWLEQELSRSKATWKVVSGHHPIYSSGHYNTNPEFVKIFTPLFKKYQVQLYINGHEHHYERTRSIDGTTYLITGIGGAYLRPVGRSPWTVFSSSRYGFTAIEVYQDRMQVTAIGTNNQVFDQGSIPIS